MLTEAAKTRNDEVEEPNSTITALRTELTKANETEPARSNKVEELKSTITGTDARKEEQDLIGFLLKLAHRWQTILSGIIAALVATTVAVFGVGRQIRKQRTENERVQKEKQDSIIELLQRELKTMLLHLITDSKKIEPIQEERYSIKLGKFIPLPPARVFEANSALGELNAVPVFLMQNQFYACKKASQ